MTVHVILMPLVEQLLVDHGFFKNNAVATAMVGA